MTEHKQFIEDLTEDINAELNVRIRIILKEIEHTIGDMQGNLKKELNARPNPRSGKSTQALTNTFDAGRLVGYGEILSKISSIYLKKLDESKKGK